jgi:hypothetical protein
VDQAKPHTTVFYRPPINEETEYPERLARNLLIEFVGGEPAAHLRDQFV